MYYSSRTCIMSCKAHIPRRCHGRSGGRCRPRSREVWGPPNRPTGNRQPVTCNHSNRNWQACGCNKELNWTTNRTLRCFQTDAYGVSDAYGVFIPFQSPLCHPSRRFQNDEHGGVRITSVFSISRPRIEHIRVCYNKYHPCYQQTITISSGNNKCCKGRIALERARF